MSDSSPSLHGRNGARALAFCATGAVRALEVLA